MKASELLSKHFSFTPEQLSLFDQLQEVILEWNQQINVVSRKETEFFAERHILHSLAIFKFLPFEPGSSILDLGTGGGFPGLPLAIALPEVNFLLVDSIGKKIKVVNEAVMALGLKNVKTVHGRVEDVKGKFDFVVSRAVAPAESLMSWTSKHYANQDKNALPNGLICLKGGDLKEELKALSNYSEVHDIHSYFPYEFFETKKLVYIEA